jgi:hypothetical protein
MPRGPPQDFLICDRLIFEFFILISAPQEKTHQSMTNNNQELISPLILNFEILNDFIALINLIA